jgi:hypothetical protein
MQFALSDSPTWPSAKLDESLKTRGHGGKGSAPSRFIPLVSDMATLIGKFMCVFP